MKEVKYCIYCKQTEKEIRKQNRREGFRIPCWARETKEGFHSYGIKIVEDK